MATVKRLNSSYTLDTKEVIITGNLTVQGIQTTVESIDTSIKDRIITLNSGENGTGVTLVTSGIEIDRGNLAKVSLVWNEVAKQWLLTNDGTTFTAIVTVAAGETLNPVVYEGPTMSNGSGVYIVNGPAADQELITTARSFAYSLLF